MKPISIKTILLGLFISLSMHSVAQKTKKYAGIYDCRSQDSLVGYLEIYPETDSAMLFFMRNSSWYNYGRITCKDSSGIYYRYTKPEPGGLNMDCMLSFKFNNGIVYINSINGHNACLCMYGAKPDGIFYISSKEIPTYFVLRRDVTIYFSNISLIEWEQF